MSEKHQSKGEKNTFNKWKEIPETRNSVAVLKRFQKCEKRSQEKNNIKV